MWRGLAILGVYSGGSGLPSLTFLIFAAVAVIRAIARLNRQQSPPRHESPVLPVPARFCRNHQCGAANKPRARYCARCGGELSEQHRSGD